MLTGAKKSAVIYWGNNVTHTLQFPDFSNTSYDNLEHRLTNNS